MNIDVMTQADDSHHITVSGEIDAHTAPTLREKLLPLTEQKQQLIVVELSGVGYMDSTALGVFIAGLKSCDRHNSHLKLVGLTPRVRRLFDVTGLNEIMDIEHNEKGSTS